MAGQWYLKACDLAQTAPSDQVITAPFFEPASKLFIWRIYCEKLRVRHARFRAAHFAGPYRNGEPTAFCEFFFPGLLWRFSPVVS